MMADQAIRRHRYLARGRAETLAAGRLLRLLRFQVNPSAPAFAPGISTYADMLDPASTDERRLAACYRYVDAVQEAQVVERHRAAEQERGSAMLDPYNVELRTTLRGALLEVISGHLANAVMSFMLADVPLQVR
jgi:hypothetical protein